MAQLDGGGETFPVGSNLCAGLLPCVEETGLACSTAGNLSVVVGVELSDGRHLYLCPSDDLTLSQAGLDLLNKLPQEKHLSPVSLLSRGASEGKTICFGLLALALTGALHSGV